MNLLDILFPPYCLGCLRGYVASDRFEALCDECFLSIRQISLIQSTKRPLNRLLWYGYYGDPVLTKTIHYFKYYGVQSLSEPLSELQIRALEDGGIQGFLQGVPACITYIPIHPLRRRFRGYNQSQLLAERLAEYFKVPCIPLLSRKWLAPPQASLRTKQEKKRNIKGSFSLLPSKAPTKVLIVDDVYTTGATIYEAARLLAKGGSRSIWAVTVAGGTKV